MIRQGFVCHLKNECTLSLLLFTDTLRSKRAKTNTSVELAGMLLPELQLIYQMDRPMSRPVEKNIFFTSFPEGSLISGLLRQWITRTAGKGRLKVKKYFFFSEEETSTSVRRAGLKKVSACPLSFMESQRTPG